MPFTSFVWEDIHIEFLMVARQFINGIHDSCGLPHCIQLSYPNLWMGSQIQHFPVRIHLLSHYLFGFFQWLWSKHIDILFTYVCVYSLFYIFTFTFILIFQIWLSDQKVYIRKFIVTLFVIIQIWKIEDIQVVNIIMTITLEWLTMYLYKLIILHDNISSVWKILMNLTIIE